MRLCLRRWILPCQFVYSVSILAIYSCVFDFIASSDLPSANSVSYIKEFLFILLIKDSKEDPVQFIDIIEMY